MTDNVIIAEPEAPAGVQAPMAPAPEPGTPTTLDATDSDPGAGDPSPLASGEEPPASVLELPSTTVIFPRDQGRGVRMSKVTFHGFDPMPPHGWRKFEYPTEQPLCFPICLLETARSVGVKVLVQD